MRIFLTGNKGRLGSRVQSILENNDHIVIGYDIIDGKDIMDPAELGRDIQGCEVVIHLAGIPHPQKASIYDYFRINVVGTLNVLRAAANYGIKRVVYSSSTGYYGLDTNIKGHLFPQYLPIDEIHPPAAVHQQFDGPLDSYNQSKVMAEQLLAWFGTNGDVQTVALRIGPANSKTEQYGNRDLSTLDKNDWRFNVMLVNCHPDFAADALVKAANLNLDLPGWSVFNITDKYLPAGATKGMVKALYGIATDRCLVSADKAERVLGWLACGER